MTLTDDELAVLFAYRIVRDAQEAKLKCEADIYNANCELGVKDADLEAAVTELRKFLPL